MRVLASGLCRSDWHGWMGHDSDITTFPHVPGHELAGVVESVAPGVDAAVAGSRGHRTLRHGVRRRAPCAGRRRPGLPEPAPARVHRPRLVRRARRRARRRDQPRRAARRPRRRSSRPAWAAASPRPTGPWSRGPRSARRRACSSSAAAGSGSRRSAIARSRGAYVCAVDVSAASLDRALFHGADEVVDASIGADRVVAAVRRGRAAAPRSSIDALGSPEACRTGILSLGRRGRHVQVGLLPPAAGRADVPMERVIGWELDVLGSHGMAAADYAPLLDDVVSGRLDLGDLLAPGEPLGLEAAGEALMAMGTTPSQRDRARRPDPLSRGAGVRSAAAPTVAVDARRALAADEPRAEPVRGHRAGGRRGVIDARGWTARRPASPAGAAPSAAARQSGGACSDDRPTVYAAATPLRVTPRGWSVRRVAGGRARPMRAPATVVGRSRATHRDRDDGASAGRTAPRRRSHARSRVARRERRHRSVDLAAVHRAAGRAGTARGRQVARRRAAHGCARVDHVADARHGDAWRAGERRIQPFWESGRAAAATSTATSPGWSRRPASTSTWPGAEFIGGGSGASPRAVVRSGRREADLEGRRQPSNHGAAAQASERKSFSIAATSISCASGSASTAAGRAR